MGLILLPLFAAFPACEVPDPPVTGPGAPVASAKVPAMPCDGLEAEAREICDVVQGSSGRVITCVDGALSRGMSLSGGFAVGFTIAEGVVTEAHLVTNTTGDDALGDCVLDVVRGLRFDRELSATVAEYPWVLAPS